MSADDAGRWKEKYLKSIEQQEKLEDRWKARLDLLRRGLVRSTLAAEGTDRTVDQCMKEMREAVRTNEMDAALAALLPRLEKAVLDSEQRRETRVEQVSAALNTLVTQLQALPLPREVSKPLKAYAKQLENRVTHAREIPLLLGELSHLQGQALAPQLNDAQPPKPGLLQRLFGAQDAEKALGEATVVPIPVETQAPRPAAPNSVVPAHVAEPPAVPTPQPEPVIVEAQPSPPVATADDDAQALAEPPPSVPLEAQEHASSGALESVVAMVEAENDQARDFVEQSPLDEQTELAEVDAVYALPDAPEPTYSSVAEHIESTLLGLLSGLSLPEHHRPQAEAMCRRLEKGLNWYELLPILDDLAVLMLAITDSGQHEFEAYLKQLNERLESFQNNLQAASEGHAEGRSAADDLHSQLREHVDGL